MTIPTSPQQIQLSVCTYNDGQFEVMIVDKTTGHQLTLSGTQNLDTKDYELINRVAPACVFTTYEMV